MMTAGHRGILRATVIIAVKRDERIIRAVDSLFHQTTREDDYEVIIVENGSDNLSHSIDPRALYYHIPEASLPGARNLGLKAAKGTYALFTDADCIADGNWIASMLSKLDGGDFAGVGGIIKRYKPKSLVQRYGANLVDGQHRLNYLPILHLPYVVGANCGFKRQLILDIGGFDSSLLSGDDVDICYKLGLKGYKIGLATDAVIYHDNRSNIIDHFKRFYQYSRFQVLLFKKYRNVSGKKFILNPYPWRLFARSIIHLPPSLAPLFLGDIGPLCQNFLTMVEAAGVICGDLCGAIENRELYI